ncbi:MAG: TraB/GumN family protein [Rubrivivax sp.]
MSIPALLRPARTALLALLGTLAGAWAMAQTPAAPEPAGSASALSAPASASAASQAAPTDAPIICPPAIAPGADGAAPGDRGVLWRLTREGRRSYLYGSLHVGKPAWRTLGPKLAAAWRDTDLLALELDPTDPAIMAALLLDRPGPALPAALRARLAQAMARACLPAAALAPLHPVLQATTLTMLEARWLGLDPAFSTEMLLAERAHAAHRRIVSLESVELQKAALVPDDPREVLATVEQNLAQLEDLSSRRVLARLVAAWQAGDLAMLERYAEWCECVANDDERAAMRRLNDERNPQLAARVAALHGQGRRVFAAVGVLHMTGAQALPALLAARGFRVERVELAR